MSPSKMRIVFLTQYFPPEIGAAQVRLLELAKYFSGCGHDVTVLTAMPNYPRGRIYPGYGGILRKEILCGIPVYRTFVYPTQNAHFVPRMMNYFSFVTSASLFGSFMLDPPDFLIVESPPLFLGIAGLWLRWWKDAKLIFNVSDLWPESAVELGIIKRNGLAARIAYWLEKLCYERAWLITGQSKSIVENIQERFPGRPVFHLSNGVDTTAFSPDRRTERARALLGSDGQFIIVYAGLHGIAQGLSQIMQAAQALEADPRFRFVLIGDGPEKTRLQKMANELGLLNMKFLDPMPHEMIPEILAVADAILVVLWGKITGAVPSKLYEAMASGRPVIVVASAEAAQIVRECDAGLVVEPNDIKGLVEGLHKLGEDGELGRVLGENGRNAATRQFNRREIFRRFTQFLTENESSATPVQPEEVGGLQMLRNGR